jgi:hypothetical protein
MSLKDYSLLLKESLATTTDAVGDGSNCVRVEHVLVITVDAAIARLADALVEIARDAVHSTRVVAYGISVFFVLWGASRLLLTADDRRRLHRRQQQQ